MVLIYHHLRILVLVYLYVTAGLLGAGDVGGTRTEDVSTRSEEERSYKRHGQERAHGMKNEDRSRTSDQLSRIKHALETATGNTTRQKGMQVIANLLDSLLRPGQQHSTTNDSAGFERRPSHRDRKTENILIATDFLPQLLEISCTGGTTYISSNRILHSAIQYYSVPLLVNDAVVIQENTETYSYEALLLFGMKANHYPFGLYAYVFEVGENRGQTMRVHDFLDLSFLPHEFQNSSTFLPVTTLSSARSLVFIYNAGVALHCSKLIIYNPSNRSIQQVETTGDKLVPRWFSSMVSVRLANDVMNDTILLFGGTHCNPYGIIECDKFSDALLEMRFTDTSMSTGKWRILMVSRSSPRPSGRVSSALFVGPNKTLILYGGISVDQNLTFPPGTHKAECDLWLFNTGTGEWLDMGHLEHDCKLRNSGYCFGSRPDNLSPTRPWAAYSTATSEITVINFDFRERYGIINGGWCSVSTITVSRRLVVGGRNDTWRSVNLADRTWVFPKLLIRTFYGVAVVGVRASQYIVDTNTMRLFNLSSTINRLSGKETVSLIVLPTLDNAFQFAGSLGCSTSPIVISETRSFEAEDFPGPHALMVGGSCLLPSHPNYLDSFYPVWNTMPVWRYTLGAPIGEGHYDMRIIEPGPPFRNQLLHTLIKLDNELDVTKAILFGGISLVEEPLEHDVWCLDTRGFYWTKANITSPAAGAPYQHNLIAGHVAVSLGNTSFLVYGGVDIASDVGATNEIFLFTFSNLSSCTGNWTNLSVQDSSGVKLPKLFLHSATFWQDRVFVYGGRSVLDFERSPLFTLKISTYPVGVHLEMIHLSASLGHRILASIVPYNSEMLLVFGGAVSSRSTFEIDSTRNRVSALIRLEPTNKSNGEMIPFFQHLPIAFQHLSQGIIMAYGGIVFNDNMQPLSVESAIIYSKFCQLKLPTERCPLGYGYSNASNACYECAIGSMSNTTEGPCQPCPRFQTTSKIGATSCYTTNPCHDNFCHGHGSCSVRNHIDAYCESCDFGYWPYDNCARPFIYIIAVSTSAAIGVLVCMLKRIRDARKEAKRKEQDLRIAQWHLKQLKNGVIVQWSELRLERLLGEGASGQVHLAKLGDTYVAVKALRRCRMNDNIFLERFSKEIENMRTVRHPNIVMFLGAGTEPTRQFPFIVMENVVQGSLFNILKCSDVSLTLERKVNFASDVSKGMEFLHSSTTPRIHCDLKSSNLLVTSNWQVKIGDFGMLRLISTIQEYDDTDPEDNLMENPPVFSRGTTSWEDNASETPLLQGDGGANDAGRNLTLSMGTARWCSPETLRHHVFNKYTDVYSYGIVLWELLTRQVPYNHVDDEDQVVEEIKNGWRPPIPPTHPEAYKYKRLMEACWSVEPEQRPLFPEIVADIEEQLHVISVRVASGTAML